MSDSASSVASRSPNSSRSSVAALATIRSLQKSRVVHCLRRLQSDGSPNVAFKPTAEWQLNARASSGRDAHFDAPKCEVIVVYREQKIRNNLETDQVVSIFKAREGSHLEGDRA
jgi:hypothetical protein